MMTLRLACACSGTATSPAKNRSSAIGRIPNMGMILSCMACNPSMKQTKDDRPSPRAQPAYPPKNQPAHQNCGGPVESKYRAPSARRGLKRQLQAELHEPGVVDCGVDRTKTASIDVVERLTELRVVEEVEEFRPEIQTHIFPGQFELFDYGEIGVDEIWTEDGNAAGVSEFTSCGLHKAGCV